MTIRQTVKPVIIGISGPELTDAERELFEEHNPLGVILFRRNIKKHDNGEQDKEALKTLIDAIKGVLGKNTIISIDQEGGRVKRLITPTFYDAPAAQTFVDVQRCKQNYSNIAKELREVGINLDFAPVVDLIHEGAHNIVGDRSFGSEPEVVVPLCLAAVDGLQEEKVQACIKHIPGHGRAKVDSHIGLPIIDNSLKELESTDFKVFKELAKQNNIKLAMTAHIIYQSLDPSNPATISKKVIDYIKSNIGFKGLIISDAIDMKALNGNMKDITKGVLDAGVDIVLECTGELDKMSEVLISVSEVSMNKFSNLFIV
ncbi:beta-N-acetylhexosaminidase [Rickettsia canadensis]|uniref:beta-N-acetylhexosaminidase n=1 Tax=Rickettsia canadensis str. CA410 TaxID=1105107 RepID=A0ABM5MS96_RICCA|nr:beta-N-acetylhexosaminidase [Rickettsia canadensis]AFB21420.1 ATP-dependent protease ATP-binding subunit [Rickettsia canadensis str. CA410]